MKTYAESQNRRPFDWKEFLNKKRRGRADRHVARFLSGIWSTCAVGVQCVTVPREDDEGTYGTGGSRGTPVDRELFDLGHSFTLKIYSSRWKDARVLLEKIEKRSAEVIKNVRRERKNRLARERRQKKRLGLA